MNIALMAITSLLPVIGWGFMPILAKRSGGTAKETMLGTTIIVFLVTLLFSLFLDLQYSGMPFFLGTCSGLFWGIGQWLQFEAIDRSTVSQVMPISNGSQLVFTTLFAWIFLGEKYFGWTAFIVFICLTVIIVGVALATKTSLNKKSDTNKRVYFIIIFSSLSLACYVTIPNFFNIDSSLLFLPQSIGMLIIAFILNLRNKHNANAKNVLKNFSTGISWLVANVSLFYVSGYLGLGLAFTISQMCVLVSIFGGIFLLKDRKSEQEMRQVYMGSMLMVIGLVIFGIVK